MQITFDLYSKKERVDVLRLINHIEPRDIDIDELNISARTKNVLKSNGITKTSQIEELGYSGLEKLNNISDKTVREILDAY